MGEVYRAVDTRLNRPVAIKIANDHFSDRFNTEARAISALNHPHVCTLYDVGPNYLVMELVEGEPLSARLAQGPLPLAEVMQYGAQIADALSAAHAKSIVHRDLKPANIILSRSGVKVVDFGIAKQLGMSVETATATQGIVGTFAYMSPEQRAGGIADARSDIYSLGLVLHEVATGTRLQPGQQPDAALRDRSDRLAHVIDRCLSQDPEDRWQSAIDVRRELEWIARAPAAATTLAPRRGYLPLAISAAVLLAIATLSVRTWRSMPTSTSADAPESRTSMPIPSGLRLDTSAPLAISPDGTLAAFIAYNDEGGRSLYLRPMAATAASELQGTTGAARPFFSPDGRSIGYFANRALHRIGVDGSAPIRICSLPGFDHGAAWGADDMIVAGIRGRGLFKVKASGGNLELIAEGVMGAWPSFLPDGVTILYSALNQSFQTVGLSIISLDGTGRRDIARLSDADGNGAPVLGSVAEIQQAIVLPRGQLVFGQDPGFVRTLPIDLKTLAPNGTARTLADLVERGSGSGGIAFAVATSGALLYAPTGNDHQLVWVTRQGTIAPLDVERGAYREPALSPDGKTIAITANNETRTPELWVIDAVRGTRSRILSDSLAPEWAPDGRIVSTGPTNALTLTPPTGGNSETLATVDDARQVIPPGAVAYATGFSPDGRYLLLQLGNTDLWRLNYATKMFEPVLSGPSNDWNGVVSSDGRHIAFTSDASGRFEVYVARWPGLDHRTAVSNRGGSFPRWSRDGSELFFWQNRTLMAAKIPPSLRLENPRPLFSGDFFGAGRDASFDIAADGRFLMVKSDERAALTQIAVLQNWIR